MTCETTVAHRPAAECHEEAPFAVRHEAEGVPAVLTGVINLVHRAAF